jgi:hypothetical protein
MLPVVMVEHMVVAVVKQVVVPVLVPLAQFASSGPGAFEHSPQLVLAHLNF